MKSVKLIAKLAMIGPARNTRNSTTNGAANPHAMRVIRFCGGGSRAPPGEEGAASARPERRSGWPSSVITVPCRWTRPAAWRLATASSTVVSPRVTASSCWSMTADTCAHVGIAGGAFESPSCSANTLRYGSSAKIGSSKADSTLGRSVEMPYHSICVSGWLSHCTNFHAASRLSVSSKTARLPPPVKLVRESAPGTIATANLSSNSAPPCSRSRLTWNGPE